MSSRYDDTFCSQCGKSFGPGGNGYSHCEDHTRLNLRVRRALEAVDDYHSPPNESEWSEAVSALRQKIAHLEAENARLQALPVSKSQSKRIKAQQE